MPRRKGSALVQTREIRADHWDAGEVVIIRALNGDDGEWIQDNLAEVVTDAQQGTQDKKSTMNMRLGKTQRLTLIRGIAAWTFTEEGGTPIHWPQLTGHTESENARIYKLRDRLISAIAPEDRVFIAREIDALNEPMNQEEQESFFENASSGTSDTAKVSLLRS